MGRSVVVNPPAGRQAGYLWFESVLADTSVGDGWVFDGSAGSIFTVTAIDCWAGYNNGNGLVTIGPNLRGVRLKGMALRESGLRGWHNRGGLGIELTAPNISANSRIDATTNYPGVEIAAGARDWAIIGGTIGNEESGTLNQGEAVKFAGASDTFRLEGVRMGPTSGGKSYLGYTSESQLTDYQMLGNLPTAVYGLNASQRIVSPFGGFVAAGATAYFEPNGPSNFTRVAPFFAGKKVLVGKIVALTGTAPGAGQSYTYRLVVNGTPVGASGVITGSDSFGTTFYPGVTLNAGDEYEVQVAGSSGASAANHRGYIQLDP